MLAVMSDEVTFAPDLYRGAAGYYDKFRLPYPRTLITGLVCRTAPSGRGRLLDLACGTGQLAFALCDSFAETWAVDQEPDMVEVVRAKAAADILSGAGFEPAGRFEFPGEHRWTLHELARKGPALASLT